MPDQLPGGVTHLEPTPQTSGTAPTGGPLDLLSGAVTQQAYDPFALDQGFGSSEFTFSYHTRTDTTMNPDLLAAGGHATNKVQAPDNYNVQPFLENLAGDPALLQSLQLQLIAAGFNIDATGSMDANTQNALQALIQEAQRDGRSLLDVLAQHAKTLKSPESKSKSLAAIGQNEFEQQLVASYIRWWGVAPTAGWIKSQLSSGQNLFEIEFNEKNKPAYKNSPTYQQNRNRDERQLSQGELTTQTFTGGGNAFSPGPAAA